MRTFWTIRCFKAYTGKWYFLWIDKPNGRRAEWTNQYGSPLNIHDATRFDTEGEAALCLSHGIKDLNWTGEFVIDKVYAN